MYQQAQCKTYTSKPSLRKHTLCASIISAHLSSPFVTTHSSRIFLVSGQLQQIFLPDFPTYKIKNEMEIKNRNIVFK